MSLNVVHTWLPAFDEKDHPKGNYGIGGLRYFVAIVGDEGAVDWELSTPMYLDHVDAMCEATAGPITIHSPKDIGHLGGPTEECHLIDGTCYSDATFLAGGEVLKRLKREGSRGMYQELLRWYNDRLRTDYTLSDLDVDGWAYRKDPHGFDKKRAQATD